MISVYVWAIVVGSALMSIGWVAGGLFLAALALLLFLKSWHG